MKKFIIWMLALSLVFALTACGGSDTADSTAPADTTATATEPESTEPESTEPETETAERLPEPTSAGEDSVGGDGEDTVIVDSDVAQGDEDDGVNEPVDVLDDNSGEGE